MERGGRSFDSPPRGLRHGELRELGIRVFIAALVVTGLPGLVVGSASAEIYRFVDPRGTIHFTDQPTGDRWEIVRFRRGSLWPTRVAPRPPRIERFDSLIFETARSLEVEPALVKAVIAAESNFDPDAVSSRGALGLMQLMPATAASLEVDDPLHPDENVRGGTSYLRNLIDRFGNLEHALAAYNAGPSPVDRYEGIPPYPETQDYVHRVLTYYRHYHDDFP
ncbi:lytic transglycosylase domain-containing protein [Myxococcota bacterium]|nr:lytic transglycosylase domain-containing protein [Myxococcota bacterium]